MNALTSFKTPKVFAQRRALIDLVAETRSRSIRVALFGTQLYRPDPEKHETKQHRSAALDVLTDTVRWIERLHLLVTSGRDPWHEYSDDLCKWLYDSAKRLPEAVQAVSKITHASQRVATEAESGGALGAALRAHYEARRGAFMPLVTQFCDQLWSEIDAERAADLLRAHNECKSVNSTLTRMERIGKHVRLVSLNASVEAARAGEYGKEVAAITQEFRSLAEEIQKLARDARADVAGII